MKVQGLDRETFLPARSRFQPYAAWYALIMSTIVLIISGYTLFYPGAFAADEFIFQCKHDFPCIATTLTRNQRSDGMVFIVIACFVGWKLVKRTRFRRGNEVDLVSDIQDLNDYTAEVSSAARVSRNASLIFCFSRFERERMHSPKQNGTPSRRRFSEERMQMLSVHMPVTYMPVTKNVP